MEKHKLKLNLELTFTEDAVITQKDKQVIIDNVLRALRSEINNGGGIAPEDQEIEGGDYITDIISIHDEEGNGIVWDMRSNRD